MSENTGRLAGKTLFITGASRGIGLNIATKCAKDGANVVIAAKTAQAHPKLPGTIYTAAKEVEEAGGQCLPCIVDIQHEDQVESAVNQAVKKFGGIDILINNASAIHLTGTESTPMKRYDLMHHVNTRGTFLCSKYCVPHLKKAENPHILNISPPLNMNPKWFKDHVAYTMAKYGMSMCALGMAEEFRPEGIAVNTLWPITAIYTAAMEMLGGGEEVKNQCRKPEIMSDAAYVMLTRNSRQFTGNFCIDEAVLREEGMTDFEQYLYFKDAKLLPDFFLDGEDPDKLIQQMEEQGANLRFKKGESGGAVDTAAAPAAGAGGPAATFQKIQSMLTEDLAKSIGGSFLFDLKDEGTWHLDLKSGSGSAGQGEPPSGEPECRMTMSGEDFTKMFAGKLNPTQAFMGGKLKIKGNLALAMKLEKLMKSMQKSKL